ncbi:hypothetical protein MNB_SV-10-1374 [hydrothermal vent metagenome]|uniref:Uncharacterized protein n=1 Tax=hydrothermal vent metagenome TaxID=652676 RepID=A0A1W1BWC8_9ZZZZ
MEKIDTVEFVFPQKYPTCLRTSHCAQNKAVYHRDSVPFFSEL